MSIFKNTCEHVNKRTAEFCGRPTVAFVSYFTDGSGGMSVCERHIASAVKFVLTGWTADSYGTAKITPLGALRDQIRYDMR